MLSKKVSNLKSGPPMSEAQKLKSSTKWIWISLVVLLSIFFSLKFGASELSSEDIFSLRLPRVILALGVGAALALSGALLQALFGNPLCEPYTLGISSGSALGAVIGATLGVGASYYGFSPTAFLGGLVFALLLAFLASRNRLSKSALLLSGVMLSFVGSSLVAVWMALADPSGIQGALTWLLGDLSRARTDSALILLGLVVVITFRLLYSARAYDALLMGDETAISVGVNITKVRNEAVFLSSVLTGLSVSGAGMIGFVGLLTPHLVRRLSSSTHRFVFPLSAILGGGILVFSDLLARVIAKPYELPVGVVTSLIGAPLFLFFMLKARARE